MASSAVVNASPLIYLARADLLSLLQQAADEVFVPDVVVAEIGAHGEKDVTVQALASSRWLHPVKSPPIPGMVLSWDLGPGESSVLACALARPECRAVIDDLQGRRCAEALRVPLRGTLGLVLRAAGMYLSDRVADAALAEVGE